MVINFVNRLQDKRQFLANNCEKNHQFHETIAEKKFPNFVNKLRNIAISTSSGRKITNFGTQQRKHTAKFAKISEYNKACFVNISLKNIDKWF